MNLNRQWAAGALLIGLTLLPLGTVCGQMIKTRTLEVGDDVTGTHMIGELGALILERDSTLTVEHVMEAAMRQEAYRSVDLKIGDVIIMANGRRARFADTLAAIMDSLGTHETIQLGIRRGDEMRMVSFPKADPSELPKMRMAISTDPEDGDAEGEPQEMRIVSGGHGDISPDDVALLSGIGVVAMKMDDQIIVANIMDHAHEVIGDADLQQGDEIVQLQSYAIESIGQLQEVFGAIAVGDEVKMVVRRDGKDISLAFPKGEARGQVIKEKG